MLNFCIGMFLGILIGVIIMAAAASRGNYNRIEEAYHMGFKDGKAANNI